MGFDYSLINIPLETEIAKDPTDPALWSHYLKLAEVKPVAFRVFLLERVTKVFPDDPQWWCSYLSLVIDECTPLEYANHPSQFAVAHRVIGDATAHCPHLLVWQAVLPFIVEKMTLEWEWDYQLFKRALETVDINHHHLIFPHLLQFGEIIEGNLQQQILRQYLQFIGAGGTGPLTVDDVFDVLEEHAQLEMVRDMIRRPLSYLTLKSPLALWKKYLALGFNQPGYEQVVLRAIDYCPDQTGVFVSALAEHNPKMARHWFLWGLTKVSTLEEFADVYKNYLDSELARYHRQPTPLQKYYIEQLVASRQKLVADIKLRLNPNLVAAWKQKVALVTSQKEKLLIYVDALTNINPLKVQKGQLAQFWDDYARIYYENNDIKTASVIFSKAVLSKFAYEELSELYERWSTMLLEQGDDKQALTVLESALVLENVKLSPGTVHARLVQFYLDIVELLVDGPEDFHRVHEAYTKLIDLKMVTANQLLNYIDFLQQNDQWQQLFQIYEQTLAKFAHPQIRQQVWKRYLGHAYSQVEPSRFQDLIDASMFGPTLAAPYVAEFAMISPTPSRLKRALAVLRTYRGKNTNQVVAEKFTLYTELATTMSRHWGPDEVRDGFEWIVGDEALSNHEVVELLTAYIKFETSQSQYQRVRALWRHITRLQHPATQLMAPLWQQWEQWEIEHGNSDLFKEMLRWKRRIEGDLKAVEQLKELVNPMGFVASNSGKKINPNQIEIDMD